MTISTAQKATLKAAILANPTWAAFPNNSDGNFDLARLLSTELATGPVLLWRTNAPVEQIQNAVDLTKYTPNGAVDDAALTLDLTVQRAVARALYCQTKLMVLQLMLQGRQTIDASGSAVRDSLKDAVTAVPSGLSGANTNPGGGQASVVLPILTRSAYWIEKILSGASQTTGATTAFVIGWEGAISDADVQQARV